MNRALGGRGRFGWSKDSGLPKRLSLIYLPDERANRFSLLVFFIGEKWSEQEGDSFFYLCILFLFFLRVVRRNDLKKLLFTYFLPFIVMVPWA